MRAATLRLIAVLLLLSGTADYLAFDVGDQLAPMSEAGTPGFVPTNAHRHLSSTGIRHTDSQDDGCLGCAPGFTAQPVELPVADVIATANALFILPASDPQLVRVDPPPRA